MSKLIISDNEISRLKQFALDEFLAHRRFGNMEAKDLQVYLILLGLYDLMKSKGIEPPFEIKKPKGVE